MPTPNISTFLRSRAGSPDASEPMMTTLSPAMVRSPMMIWPSFASPPAVSTAAKSKPGIRVSALLVHGGEEVLVGFGVLHLIEEELHRIDRPHLHQDPAQDPHLGEDVLVYQKLFLPGARFADVERREDALVGDLAVEHDFAVAGALELFEDDFVHL